MNKNLKGAYFSLATMLFWGMSVVSTRYAVVNLEMHPFLLATIRIFIASMALLFIAGKGSKVCESIKNPYTWIYSSLQIFLNIFTAATMIYITSTEATLLQRFNIILGITLSFLLFKKKSSKVDVLGCVFILLGILALLLSLETKQAFGAMIAVFFAAFCHVFRTIIAERHPVAKGATSFREYCRVLSYILLVTSVTFMCFALIVGNIISIVPMLENFNFLPILQNSFTKQQLLFATFTGVCLVTPSMYFFFSTARIVGATNFLIYVAYLPIVSFIVELVVSSFGFIKTPHLNLLEILSAVLIMGGASIMAYFRNKNNKVLSKQNKTNIIKENISKIEDRKTIYKVQYLLTIVLGLFVYCLLWTIAK